MPTPLAPAVATQLGLQLIDRVLGHEGGYVDHPDDRGGPTNWGVTQTTARRFGYFKDMQNMTRSEAIQVYLQLFWVNRFQRVAQAGFPDLAYAMLDFGVNSGEGRPAEALQRALNALNQRQALWADIAVDGGIGPMTIRALEAAGHTLGDEAEDLLSFTVNCLRVAFIINLAERSESQEVFVKGWLRRMRSVSLATIGKA